MAAIEHAGPVRAEQERVLGVWCPPTVIVFQVTWPGGLNWRLR